MPARFVPRPETLCDTCASGTTTILDNGRRVVRCDLLYPARRVLRRVTDCTGYVERNARTRSDYEKTAWILDPATRTADRIGFVRPGTPEHAQLLKGGKE